MGAHARGPDSTHLRTLWCPVVIANQRDRGQGAVVWAVVTCDAPFFAGVAIDGKPRCA